MRNLVRSIILLFFVLQVSAQEQKSVVSKDTDDNIVDAEFLKPGSAYGTRCWWWWLNGNVTRQSITRDLEEMKAKGFSGACIFDAGGANQVGNNQVPEGPMFGSPDWRALYLYAIREANRLGLVMSMNIQSGWNLGGPDVTPAEAAKQVTFSELGIKGGTKVNQKLAQPAIRDNYYKEIAVLAFPDKNSVHAPIHDLENKTASKEAGGSVPDTRPFLTDIAGVPGEEDALSRQVINISKYFKDGVLNWDAPAGNWRVVRIGYTPTDARTSTTSGKWHGRVLDFLSEKSFNRYWDTHVEPLLRMIGPMAGTTLRYLQTDSFEGGGMNWTDGFADEFKKRRGYDLTPFLPVLTGKIIESRSVSIRFLNDFRKTLGDLVSEKHYGTFAKRSRAHGIGILPESAGPHAGPFDGLKNYGHSEVMMSEFWSPSPHRPRPIDRFFVKQAASAAKIFNKRLVGAESFTTIGHHWNDVIWADMKPSVDHEFCAGLNLVYFHTFTSSPKEMGMPGQEYFAGTHFNPNVTWWNYSTAFLGYLTRCHYLLQKGTALSDVLYYYGDHVPNLGRLKEDDPAGALLGYDYDLINEDRLLDLTVRDGKIELPHGVNYRVLVLPDHKILSLAVIRKVKTLVHAGATVIGLKPESTSSLVGYPAAETELHQIADELWGKDKTSAGEKVVGKGKVIWGKTAAEVLLESGLPYDVKIEAENKADKFDYIHRYLPDGSDIYFISNQNKKQVAVSCSFRMVGRQPEIWDPLKGEIRDAKAYKQEDGLITVPLAFDPNGSVFVVFKKPLGSKEGTEPGNYPGYKELEKLSGAWDVHFDPKWGGPASVKFDTLQSWTERPEDGIRFYSGTAVYTKSFRVAKEKSKRIFLDLGEVKDVGIAKVKLNGKDLGILWSPPFRTEITAALKTGDNKLEIEIVNSWRNRLIGDNSLPADQRLTKTNIKVTPAWKILSSGLLGPVVLMESDL
jgi:hypothetical protein